MSEDYLSVWRAEIKCNTTKAKLITMLESCIREQYNRCFDEYGNNSDPLDELIYTFHNGCVAWKDKTEDQLIDEIDGITDWFEMWCDEGATHEIFEPVERYLKGEE